MQISTIQQDSCGTLIINDITGAYAVANTSGWKTTTSGGTNIQIDASVMDEAELGITPPGSATEIIFDLMDAAVWQALTPYTTGQPFDSSTLVDTLAYTITEALLGVTMIDGLYTIRYYVKDTNAVTTTVIFTVAVYCKVECCVNGIVNKIPDYYQCESCDNTYLRNANEAKAMLEALKLSACGGITGRFEDILETLQDICETMGCTCS